MTQSSLANALRNQEMASVLQDAETRYLAANPRSAKLNAEAQVHLPGGNTRTTVHYSPFPLSHCVRPTSDSIEDCRRRQVA